MLRLFLQIREQTITDGPGAMPSAFYPMRQEPGIPN